MSRRHSLTQMLVLAVAASCSLGQAWFQPLGYLHEDDLESWAMAIATPDGPVVAGYCITLPDLRPGAFRWTEQTGMVDLGDLPGGEVRSDVWGISGDGGVIVGMSYSEQGYEAYRWSLETGMIGLGDLPGGLYYSEANGVSPDGSVVVGSASVKDLFDTAFVWTEVSGMTPLADVGEEYATTAATDVSGGGAVIVGNGGTDEGMEAWRWTSESGVAGLGLLPGHSSSLAAAVSPDGQVVVGSSWGATSEAFRWTADSGMVGLGQMPGGLLSTGRATSADGQVVVGDAEGESEPDAFVWTEQDGMRGLRTTLLAAGIDELTNWYFVSAGDVSDDGTLIVGTGINPLGMYEGWIAHLPQTCEPDLNADGILDLFDFLAFVNLFNAGDPRADCDQNGGLDLFDFLCFVNAFNAGC